MCLATSSNLLLVLGPEVTLQPLATSCAKDYKGHSLMQTSFTEPPNKKNRLSVASATDLVRS